MIIIISISKRNKIWYYKSNMMYTMLPFRHILAMALVYASLLCGTTIYEHKTIILPLLLKCIFMCCKTSDELKHPHPWPYSRVTPTCYIYSDTYIAIFERFNFESTFISYCANKENCCNIRSKTRGWRRTYFAFTSGPVILQGRIEYNLRGPRGETPWFQYTRLDHVCH